MARREFFRRVLALCALVWANLLFNLAVADATSITHPAFITVVVDDNYPPYIFRDEHGHLQGILKDRWDLWAQRTHIAVQLQGMDWSSALATMEAGNADVIDTMFFTAARAQLYDFSQPYATLEAAIFFHRSISGISSVENLHGFTIGVKAGDACIDWLTAHGINDFKPYPSYAALIDAAEKNAVRLFCIDKPPAQYLLYQKHLDAEFRYAPALYSGQFHWAVKKNNSELKHIIEQGFATFSPPEIADIDAKWLGYALPAAPFYGYGKYIVAALLLIIGGAVGLVIWSRMLQQRVRARTAALSAALDALSISQKHFEDLVTTTPVGVFEADAEGKGIYANQQWLDLAGLTLAQALGSGWESAVHPDDWARVMQEWANALADGRPYQIEHRYLHADGKVVWIIAQGSLTKDANSALIGYIGSATDITERKLAEAHAEYLTHHDILTGLPNRLLLKDRLDLAMAYAERSHSLTALLYLDLDHFKTINDALGHAAGDAVLKAVAQRIQHCLRDTDTISRQGGDEFLIVLAEIRDTEAITSIAANILEQLSQPFKLAERELSTSLSIGIAVFPEDGRDFDTLLKKSDIAMYHAKAAGRHAYRFYAEQMNIDASEYLQVRAGLQRALERDEFVLYYQPQIDLQSNKVIGAEALIRWQHPELGLLAPLRFIAIAEDSALIVPIGEWVLRTACRQAAIWRDRGAPLTIAVNLSSVQFARANMEHTVVSALSAAGLEPSLLELELTESMLIDATANVLDTVQRLTALGVKFSIDDFGTGYSNLVYVKRFDVDKLKIDRSFVKDLADDAEDAAITRAIIQMAHGLGLKAVAEGVENAASLDYLRAQGCDEAQGYWFSKPIPADEFYRYLQNRQQ